MAAPNSAHADRTPDRYDPTTGDLKLVCARFPAREDNRRWCLAALHRLLVEANRAHPSPGFLLDRHPSVLLDAAP